MRKGSLAAIANRGNLLLKHTALDNKVLCVCVFVGMQISHITSSVLLPKGSFYFLGALF